MSEIKSLTLTGTAETLLITLDIQAMESQRPGALIKDEKAEALFSKIRDDRRYDFGRMKSLHLSEANKLVIILRNREFDRYTCDFLRHHPDAVVVHIGCGLDTRFERVDNGLVEWFDLDLPDVIDLRRELISDDGGCYHLLGCSVVDSAWLEAVSVHRQRPFLFLAEGVFMYFEGAQVKSLVQTLLREQRLDRLLSLTDGTLVRCSMKVASGRLAIQAFRSSDKSTEELFKELQLIKGIGPYAAGNLLRLLSRNEHLAINSWLRSQYARIHRGRRRVNDASIEWYYAPYGDGGV